MEKDTYIGQSCVRMSDVRCLKFAASSSDTRNRVSSTVLVADSTISCADASVDD